MSLLVAILLAAGVGALGPRTAEATASGDGWSLGVTFPQVTRAGQPAPLSLTVTSTSGLGETVALRLCDRLFDQLDFQAWYPGPATETADGPWIYYEFDPPPAGDTLEVTLDARSAPGPLGGRTPCDIAVLVGDRPVAEVSFTVWRLP